MQQLTSSFKNMILVLAGISLFAAATLASVYTFTKEPIAIAKANKLQNAIKEVLPADFARIGETEKIVISTGDSLNVYKAYNADNNFIGAAVESVSHKGFAGDITIMVGFDAEGKIVNYSVLEQSETPGLGTKMTEWFKTAKGRQDIRGKNPASDKLQVSKDGGEVDAITAATISSRAFLDAVINAYNAYAANSGAPEIDGNSGATALEW
ncbi:MAG: RnfABCDGE type electron transport complex subunit G [Paludibacter sp.]|jgi:electron transport complex protein RnfG|nr:RnfABCDGE type electron transport complex subunit G [Paludibacter sp.]